MAKLIRMYGWISAQDSRYLYISATTILELERGILSIQRWDIEQESRLSIRMDSRVRPEFAARTISIDDEVATRCAHLYITDRRNEADAIIAGTARVRGLVLVTRNVQDFRISKEQALSSLILGLPEVSAARVLQLLPPDELENLRFDGFDTIKSLKALRAEY